jgi:hypothetical protein
MRKEHDSDYDKAYHDTDIPSRLASQCSDCKSIEVMTSTKPLGTRGSVAFLLASTLYQTYKRTIKLKM